MKKFGKKVLSLLMAGTMLTSLLSPAFAAEEGTDTTVINDKGRTLHFLDIGSTQLESDEVDLYKKAIQSNHFFEDWVCLAYNIFKSQPSSYWDHAGKGWDKSYGYNTEDGEEAEYIDFVGYMLEAQERTIEEEGLMDENVAGYVSSGLSVADSLAEVQLRAAEDIASLPNRKISDKEFLERHDIDVLTGEKRKVLYSTVTTFDRYGRTGQIGYDSFTIAFYDFQLCVLSNEDVLTGQVIPVENAGPKEGFVTLTENYGLSDVTGQATLANGVQESLATTITNSSTYSFGQSIGGTIGGEAKIPLLAEGKIQISGKLSFGQIMETAYSETKSITETVDKSYTITTTIPAHTVQIGQQTLAEETYTVSYDCPVGITYKVAIFSMCGTCYDDNIGVQQFDTAGYEQRSFVTIFGGSTDASDAVESLYQRATKHGSDASYEKTYGCTKGTDDDGDVWCTYLDWNTIIGQGAPASAMSGLKGGTNLISALDDSYPMSVAGAITTEVQETIATTQGAAQPILPIASTFISWQMDNDWSLDRAFELTVGETVPISSYRVQATDRDAVPYYGFVATKGTWKIVNEQGKDTDAEGKPVVSAVAEMVYDPITGSQTLKATGEGTTYVKYFIPEEYYYTYDGVASTNANISSPAYKVVVSAVPEEKPASFAGTIEINGFVEAAVGESVNLATVDTLSVAAYDTTDKKVKATFSWEARELEEDGIAVTTDGVLTATKEGTFHVRAYIDDVYSDWVEVIASQPNKELILYVCYHPFADVPHGSWYEPAVEFVYQNDIMNGVKADRFDPAVPVTRAQVVQTLYNLAGEPFVVSENPFADVAGDAWYAKAVAWAAANGLTTGKSTNRFDPNAPVTREQLVTFACRYAEWAGLELSAASVDLTQYVDANEVSGWAKDFVVRALGSGIIQGKNAETLAPLSTATRAEFAQIFQNLLEE